MKSPQKMILLVQLWICSSSQNSKSKKNYLKKTNLKKFRSLRVWYPSHMKLLSQRVHPTEEGSQRCASIGTLAPKCWLVAVGTTSWKSGIWIRWTSLWSLIKNSDPLTGILSGLWVSHVTQRLVCFCAAVLIIKLGCTVEMGRNWKQRLEETCIFKIWGTLRGTWPLLQLGSSTLKWKSSSSLPLSTAQWGNGTSILSSMEWTKIFHQ